MINEEILIADLDNSFFSFLDTVISLQKIDYYKKYMASNIAEISDILDSNPNIKKIFINVEMEDELPLKVSNGDYEVYSYSIEEGEEVESKYSYLGDFPSDSLDPFIEATLNANIKATSNDSNDKKQDVKTKENSNINSNPSSESTAQNKELQEPLKEGKKAKKKAKQLDQQDKKPVRNSKEHTNKTPAKSNPSNNSVREVKENSKAATDSEEQVTMTKSQLDELMSTVAALQKQLENKNDISLQDTASIEVEKNVKKAEAKVISVFSGKGGVGKTTVAVSLAVAISRIPKGRGFARVLLLDFDTENPDVCTILNVFKTGYTLENALDKNVLEIAGNPTADGIVLKDLYVVETDGKNNARDNRELKDNLESILRDWKEADYFDYIIIDTGNTLNRFTNAALNVSDDVFIVYTPDFTTVEDNERSLDRMEVEQRSKCKAIINKADDSDGSVSAESIKKALEPMEILSVITVNKDISSNNNNAMPTVLMPDNPLLEELMCPLDSITGEKYTLPSLSVIDKPKGFKKFFSMFKKRN